LFNYPTQLKRHLTGKTHGMNNDDAQDLAGTAFGKEIKNRQSRSKRPKSALVADESDEDEQDEEA
jgi:hypothetical protein